MRRLGGMDGSAGLLATFILISMMMNTEKLDLDIDFVVRVMNEALDIDIMRDHIGKCRYCLTPKDQTCSYVVFEDAQWIKAYKMTKVCAGIDSFSGYPKWILDFQHTELMKSDAKLFFGDFDAMTFAEALQVVWPRKAIISG